jgi:hypothetical protein
VEPLTDSVIQFDDAFIGHLQQSFKELNGLAKQVYPVLQSELESLIHAQVTDAQQIERLLDQMLNFAFYSDILILYKRLFRYYYFIDTQATVFYVNSYREMWDSDDEIE